MLLDMFKNLNDKIDGKLIIIYLKVELILEDFTSLEIPICDMLTEKINFEQVQCPILSYYVYVTVSRKKTMLPVKCETK